MIVPSNLTPISGIIQVGACQGTEIQQFVSLTNNIICFEPVLEVRNECIEKAKQYPNANIIISDYIVSNKTGDVEFFVAKWRDCSSLFDLNPNAAAGHLQNCAQDKKIVYKSTTLDDFFNNEKDLDSKKYNYLYIDVQGAEHLVLEGAKQTLKNIDYIWMEVSYFELYLNTVLFHDMTKLCEQLGYTLQYHQSFNDIQGNALYVKKELL